MQITVESTTKEPKQARGQTYWGVKYQNDWYNLFVDSKPAQGAKFDCEVKTSDFNGKTYRWATPTKAKEQPAEQQASSNGSWEHYAEMARAAHALAAELEADAITEAGIQIDRSHARAAILNTVMIAYSNGKVALPAEPEPPEFGGQGGDDIPF